MYVLLHCNQANLSVILDDTGGMLDCKAVLMHSSGQQFTGILKMLSRELETIGIDVHQSLNILLVVLQLVVGELEGNWNHQADMGLETYVFFSFRPDVFVRIDVLFQGIFNC
jgi:hypothetical protein